nr:T-box transcription factor TBX20-like [Cherax quadricarinatus]
MLSSRAAAFSVKALLTAAQEKTDMTQQQQQQQHHHQQKQHQQQQQQQQHHQQQKQHQEQQHQQQQEQHQQQQQQHHQHQSNPDTTNQGHTTHNSCTMVETKDDCEHINSYIKQDNEKEVDTERLTPYHISLEAHTREENLFHQDAERCQQLQSENSEVADLSKDTDDDELVVDVENCNTPPVSNSTGEDTVDVSLPSLSDTSGITVCANTRRGAPVEQPAQHFTEHSSPDPLPEWQMLSGSCRMSLGWRDGEGVDDGCGGGVSMQLLQYDLWTKFHNLSTEMIITKNGRRMFPVVKVKIRGLRPEKTYMVYLDMVAVDTRRYRYVYPSSRWMVAGTGEPLGQHTPYIHPDSPATGVQWMASPAVAFDRLKLTNNKTREVKGQIILHSMQKYRTRVWVQEVEAGACWGDLPHLVDQTHAHHASFPETTFITVTAYQNQQITRLKIDSNPFAKGFRDATKQKELERHPSSLARLHESASMESSMLMLPLGVPPPHLHYASPMAGFSPPFSLAGTVSPPVSPLLLPSQWFSGVTDGGDRPLPWVQAAMPLFQSAPPTLPILIPPFLPTIHTQLPHALDLSKPKDNT